MSVAIAVFVKTPGRSALKTRLAEAIGAELATDCHARCAAAVAEVLEAIARTDAIAPYWAVAETEGLGAWPGFAALPQGDGSLGVRMARVHRELCVRHGAAILVGADAPQLDAGVLRSAAEWLGAGEPRLALGPASDGGFWLFGANRVLPEADWAGVAYSRADTAASFRAAMSAQGRWLDLPRLTDLDRIGDLAPVAGELAALAAPLPKQRALATWLASLARRTAPST